jgi:hypothetical protein
MLLHLFLYDYNGPEGTFTKMPHVHPVLNPRPPDDLYHKNQIWFV